MENNIDSMSAGDIATLFVVAGVASTTIAAEVQDIWICHFASLGVPLTVDNMWRHALCAFVGAVRLFIFTPFLTSAIPVLILM